MLAPRHKGAHGLANDPPTASELTITRRQASKLRKHLSSFQDSDQRTVKICLIGSGGIGKESITYRWVHNDYSGRHDPTRSDHEKRFVSIQGYDVQIEIREFNIDRPDFRGSSTSEELLEQAFLRFEWHDACLLVYDGTRRETFGDLQRFYETKLKRTNEEPLRKLVFVVASRSDRAPDWEVPASAGRGLAVWMQGTLIQMSAMENVGTTEEDLVSITSMALLQKISKEELVSVKDHDGSFLKRFSRWFK